MKARSAVVVFLLAFSLQLVPALARAAAPDPFPSGQFLELKTTCIGKCTKLWNRCMRGKWTSKKASKCAKPYNRCQTRCNRTRR